MNFSDRLDDKNPEILADILHAPLQYMTEWLSLRSMLRQMASDGTLHIARHHVTEEEIDEAFNDHEYLWRKRKDGSYIALSKLNSGRRLQIVFRKIRPVIISLLRHLM